MTPIPETAALPDWPRKVAGKVNDHERSLKMLEDRITGLEAATEWVSLGNFADDTAALAGGVEIGGLYRTGSILKVRVA